MPSSTLTASPPWPRKSSKRTIVTYCSRGPLWGSGTYSTSVSRTPEPCCFQKRPEIGCPARIFNTSAMLAAAWNPIFLMSGNSRETCRPACTNWRPSSERSFRPAPSGFPRYGEKQITPYPQWAIRELLMNAVMHRDYQSNAPVRFYRVCRPDRNSESGWTIRCCCEFSLTRMITGIPKSPRP